MCFTSKTLYFTWGEGLFKIDPYDVCVCWSWGGEMFYGKGGHDLEVPKSLKEPLTLYIPVVPSTMCSVVNILFWQQLM